MTQDKQTPLIEQDHSLVENPRHPPRYSITYGRSKQSQNLDIQDPDETIVWIKCEFGFMHIMVYDDNK